MKPAAARLRVAQIDDLDALVALEQHFTGDRMSRRAFRHLLHSASATIWLAQASAQTLGALVLLTRRGSRRARIYSVVVSRSEERRVGKACVSTCRSRWSAYH